MAGNNGVVAVGERLAMGGGGSSSDGGLVGNGGGLAGNGGGLLPGSDGSPVGAGVLPGGPASSQAMPPLAGVSEPLDDEWFYVDPQEQVQGEGIYVRIKI